MRSSRAGGASRRKAFLGRYVRRMWSVSEFMKTLKQATSQSFNARLKHAGTMWEARFRARAFLPDEKAELMKVAGYIDRNPVKTGIVKWPDGSHGGDRLSVTAEKLDSMRERRWAAIEPTFPSHVPRLLSRGSNKVARDLLAVLADKPKRPADLRRELGVSSPNYFTSCYLTPLAAAGFIVSEGACHSPQRTYRLTAKGRRVLT